MRRVQHIARNVSQPVRAACRFYSDSNKYRSIEDFNKNRVEYNFNKKLDHLEEQEWAGKAAQNSARLHERVAEQLQNEEDLSIGEQLEQDPRLSGLENGSPEYKEQLAEIHQEFLSRQKHDQKKWEYRERFKAIGLGIAAIVGIVGAHNVFMNYEYYKNWIFKGSYGVQDKPVVIKNQKHVAQLVAKLEGFVNDKFVSALHPSDKVLGLYVFGAQNNSKYPVRLSPFDHLTLKDVEVSGKLLVAISDDGKLLQYVKGSAQPKTTKLPFKAEKCVISKDSVYILTHKGQVAYTPRLDAKEDHESVSARSWMWRQSSTKYDFVKFENNKTNILQRGEKIRDMSSGDNHLLLLSDKGRIFTCKTAEGDNFGQFGTPDYSPFAEGKIPLNEATDLTTLNNEVVTTKTDKFVRLRTFNHIAAGQFHNIASDSVGNIWAWGKNTSGECGVEVSYKNDVQAVPKKVLTKQNLLDAYKLNSKISTDDVQIEGLHANDETSLVNLRVKNDDVNQSVILTFGNGLRGQLGINRYLHVCHKPQVIKSLTNLNEYNEDENAVTTINIDSISTGKNHSFIKLGNSGDKKEIFSFGDNESFQFGNGRVAKSSKPTELPPLMEPADFEAYVSDKKTALKNLAKKLNDPSVNRLQLSNTVLINKKEYEQVIKATDDTSVIFYKKK